MSLVLLHRRETKEDFHLQILLRRTARFFLGVKQCQTKLPNKH